MRFMAHRRLYAALALYAIVVVVLYSLPAGLSVEWYDFYSYLDAHHALPYVDTREGYPPLGFLVYMPLYYVFRGNAPAFYDAFRAVNGAFLVATVFLLYLILLSRFEEKRALRLAILYGLLPSVLTANLYSNDIIALLPAALAIYMILKKRPLASGLLIGLATLGKGFPLLLLIPALIMFEQLKDKVKVIGTTLTTLAVGSLPFMLLNPFTYISTFTHVGSRGPWETVWALIEGFYSHGGLLHPYFDKFFYHQNLLQVYTPTPFDNAIYAWKFDILPSVITLGEIGVIVLLSLACRKNRENVVATSGLLYLGNMLFFKGYSTQFAVSTMFYALLATWGPALYLLVFLEGSHIMQLLAWQGQSLAPEFLRNEHQILLFSAVVLRTIIFAALVFLALKKSRLGLGDVRSVVGGAIGYLGLLKDRMTAIFLASTVFLAGISAASLYSYTRDPTGFRTVETRLGVTQGHWENVTIDGLKTGDKVMVRLHTRTWLDTRALFDSSEAVVERGVVNPYNLKGSFNETMLFFRAQGSSCNLGFRMKQPIIPFRITDGLDGDLDIDIHEVNSSLVIELRDMGLDGRGSFFRMAYPCEVYAKSDFSVQLKYTVMVGSISKVLLDVFDDRDEWLYTYEASEDFVLKADAKDVYGKSNLANDPISLVALVIPVEDGAAATVRVDSLSIAGSAIPFYAEESEEILCTVFVQRDFEPSSVYGAALMLAVVSGVATVFLAYRRAKSKEYLSIKIE